MSGFLRLRRAVAPWIGVPALLGATPAVNAASIFTDVSEEAGLHVRHRNGAAGEFRLEEIMGSGGAFLDHDGDGDLDLYLVQSTGLEATAGATTGRLLRNDAGHFVDVTAVSGAGVGGYSMGSAVCDWDRDGDFDLYITRVGPDVALRNEGDGTFVDATAALGLATPGFGSSAAFFDADRDGWPDLYVTRYVSVPGPRKRCTIATGQRDYCNPTAYPATTDVLYSNAGGHRFVDVSEASGISTAKGYGLALTCTDFDEDGDVDVYVANDQSPAFLWRNRGDGTFQEDGLLAGCAYNDEGAAIAGMGTAAADFDSDGDLDLLVTNIREEPNLFLRNEGGSFADAGWAWGVRGWLRPHTGFGVVTFDQDHDGALDLFIANGSVVRVPSPLGEGAEYRQPNQFLRRDAEGRFVDASSEMDARILAPAVSRGVARGDYDEDGDVDLLICRNDARPQLLRNDGARGNWLLVEPELADGSRPVLNARVVVESGGTRRVGEVLPYQSYLTTSDARVHFGLGSNPRVESLSVRWPDGAVESWRDVAINQIVRPRRGTGERESER